MLAFVLLIVPIELALLYYTVRRSGFVPFPHLLLFCLIAYQLSVFVVSYGIAEYSFLRTYSHYSFESHYFTAQAFFTVIFTASFFLFLPAPNVGYLSKVQRSIKRAGRIRLPFEFKDLWIIVVVFWVYHLALFLILNWPLVWRNTEYLLMRDQRILSIANRATEFLIALLPFVGILVFAMVGIYAWQRGRFIAAALAPLAAFDLLFQVGAHSRKAVLYILIYAGLSYMIRKDRVAAIAGSLLAFVVLVFTLGGREYEYHGISTIFTPISVISTYFKKDPTFAILNIFQGAFNTTELITRSYESSTLYKLMSFVPLPSFIVGFGELRETQMHKLGPFSPPSAIFEAWSFGAPFIVVFIVTQILAGRLVVSLANKKGGEFVGIVANALMAIATYLEFTYPMRQVYRMFLIAMVLAWLGHYLVKNNLRQSRDRARNNTKGGTANRRRPPATSSRRRIVVRGRTPARDPSGPLSAR